MKRISRLPVWWQLFIGLACCFLFSLIVICASFFIDIKEAEKNNWSYLHRMNSQWELEIETITKDLDYLQYLPLIDKEIMTNLRNDYQKQSLKKQLSNSNYVNNILEDICGINPFILRATILTKNGNIYGNFVEDSLKQVEQAQDHIVYSKAGHKNEKHITDIYEGEINMLPYKLLTIAYAMYPVTSDEKLATIYIDLNFEEIEKSFSVFSNDEIDCCLFNKNGMIYSSEKENNFLLKDVKNIYENSDHQGVLETDGTVWNAYVVKITDLDWYLVQCMPKKSFTFNSTKNILPFCFWVLMIFVFLLFGGMQLISRITKPISEFSNALNQVTLHKKQKPRHIQLSEDVPEEISTMVSGYNDLVSRIEENIILAYKNEISQKKTELQMLQYQINPHFLYNTLNIVSALAKLNGIKEISEISESLSHIFHYNVKGGNIVQLKMELENLQCYVKIQSLRFPGKFDVIYNVDEEMMTCEMLKFILQPLMENAIEHGVIPCKKRGRIELTGKISSDHIAEISICDNGNGINDETLQMLRQELKKDLKQGINHSSSGIGLINVHQRIKNYYGEEFGISIESTLGEYTCIKVRFPILPKEV